MDEYIENGTRKHSDTLNLNAHNNSMSSSFISYGALISRIVGLSVSGTGTTEGTTTSQAVRYNQIFFIRDFCLSAK